MCAEVTDHTLQLVSDHCSKAEVRMKKMVKAQNKECRTIQSHDHQDAQQVAKVTSVPVVPNSFASVIVYL